MVAPLALQAGHKQVLLEAKGEKKKHMDQVSEGPDYVMLSNADSSGPAWSRRGSGVLDSRQWWQ